jgi:ferredoxin
MGTGKSKNTVDFSRRQFVLSSLAGIATAGVLATSSKRKGNFIRPPGSLNEKHFLDRCIRCMECVKICSSTGKFLQPSYFQTGWEALWTPVGKPSDGYCEYECKLCGKVCPTGAIQKVGLGTKQNLKIGSAFFDKSRCIPWFDHQDCLVCEEHCPIPEKAIRFDERDVLTRDGSYKKVKFPFIVQSLCNGCGICENKCPVIGRKGIFITSANAERVNLNRNI